MIFTETAQGSTDAVLQFAGGDQARGSSNSGRNNYHISWTNLPTHNDSGLQPSAYS
jgi:hypothetical protein